MPHVALLPTLVAALGFALLFGVVARRLKLPTLVGYLAAGVAIGPYTPGFIGDPTIAAELSEIGVILLMFGVGLHFSPRELAEARWVAIPGALGTMAIATVLGWGLARAWGWSDGAGLLFGFCLSVASTVVLLRTLTERGQLSSPEGRIAVGWLVVEDLAMVLALVLVPAAAAMLDGDPRATAAMAGPLLLTLTKVTAFVALMLFAGSRVLPWALSLVASLRSRELFSLAALVAALGVAFAASALFEVSFALGAFLGGLALGQSPLGKQAAEQTLPMRDAFAVLFFVSVGMLFDPGVLWREPGPVLATVAVVAIGKAMVACLIARGRGLTRRKALTVAASLAQIGEFSFILAALGVAQGVLPEAGRDLILAAALLTIALNPLMFRLVDRLAPVPREDAAVVAPAPA